MSLPESTEPLESGALPQPLKALGRERLIDRAAAAIKSYILANRLNRGDRLPSETELARSLSVSRNIIRQAITSLEALGILEVRHGRGIYVADISNSSVFEQLAAWMITDNLDDEEFVEARSIFERGLLELVMKRATEEDFDRLERLATQLHDATDTEVQELHDAFHQALLATTRNSFLMTLGTILYRFFWKVGYSASHVTNLPARYLQNSHCELVRLLRKRRTSDIPQIIRLHLGYTHRLDYER